MATTVFRGTREDISRTVSNLAEILSGRAADPDGIGRGFLSAIGFAALSDIKDAYVTKARGGTDEMGIRWPELSPTTVANRRVGHRDRRENTDIARRERIRQRETRRALSRFRLSLPEGEAQRRAAIVGGIKATQLTGRTKLQTLGNRQVEILRDTDVLLNSLSPGELSNQGRYTKPTAEGGEEQIFELAPGEVTVGTNVKYASTHQHGDSSRNIPARPFLPGDQYPVPSVWWARWLDVANRSLLVFLQQMLTRRT